MAVDAGGQVNRRGKKVVGGWVGARQTLGWVRTMMRMMKKASV